MICFECRLYTPVWSWYEADVVPKKQWRLARSMERLHRAHMKFNKAISAFVAINGGIFFSTGILGQVSSVAGDRMVSK